VDTKVHVDIEDKDDEPKSVEPLHQSWLSYLKMDGLLKDTKKKDGDDVPIVFCYSLFYIYYDQYSYITGVLAQDVLMGIVVVFTSI